VPPGARQTELCADRRRSRGRKHPARPGAHRTG